MKPFRRGESGQALVIAAMGAFVLAAAFALTIDWGYALLQRRVAQNDADKIALGVGRLLATTVVAATSSTTTFSTNKGEACDEAEAIHNRDGRSTRPAVGQGDPIAPLALWLTFEGPGADDIVNCTTISSSVAAQTIDNDTSGLRVRVEIRYRALVGISLWRPGVSVAGTSRVALEGAPYAADGSTTCDASRAACIDVARSATAIARTWPLARFYQPSEFLGTPCGPLCDPTTTAPLVFATDGNMTPGVELLDLSRHSARHASVTPPQLIQQLLTGWDTTGSLSAGTSPKPDESGVCGRDWDTAGGENPATQNANCSLPNWFDHPVGATLGLNTAWRDDDFRAEMGTPAPVEPPSLNTSRAACVAARLTYNQRWLTTPSCDSGSVGDWVETAQRGIGPDIVRRMSAFIDREGITTPFSDDPAPTGRDFGKAVVVWVYLWDCGQEFNGDEDSLWNQIDDDCRRRQTRRRPIDLRPPQEPADRVHLFSVVPFTFYEGLVTDTAIGAYWGGGFVDAGRCQPDRGTSRDCPLNPLANSAFLVADD